MKLYNIASRTISWLQLVNHLLCYKIIWLKSFLVPLKHPRLISRRVLSPRGICGSCSYTFVDDISYAHDSTLCTWSVWHTIKRSANIFVLFCQPSSSLGGRTLACLERRLLRHRCGRRGRENKRVACSDAHRTSAVRFTPLRRHLRRTRSSAPTDLNGLFSHFHLLTRFVIEISLQFVLRNQSVTTCPRPCNTCCFYVSNVSHPLNDSIQNGRH